jgi:hypothetical protein
MQRLVQIVTQTIGHPVPATAVGVGVFSLLLILAEHLVNDVLGILPAPPPAVPLDDQQPGDPMSLVPLLILFSAAIYVFVAVLHHQKTGPPKHGRNVCVALILAFGMWMGYSLVLYPRCTYQFSGQPHTIGLYLTADGSDYLKNHSFAEMIQDHPEQLGVIWTERSVAISQFLLVVTYLVTMLALVTLAIVAKEAVKHLVWL